MQKVKNKKRLFIGLIALVAVIVIGSLVVRGENFTAMIQGITVEQPKFSPDMLKFGGWYCYNEDCETENPSYVIITRPIFVTAIQDFVDWKRGHGFNVGVLTVEYINTIQNENNPAKNIRETIKDFAQNHNTKYFVLIGDTKITTNNLNFGNQDPNVMYDMTAEWNVPSGYYCRYDLYQTNPDYAECIEVTDLYYADFDDSAWAENADGYIMRGIYSNGYWHNGTNFIKYQPNYQTGEFLTIDPRILDFETIVARIPIRTPEEFDNVFNKMQNYSLTSAYDFLGFHSLTDIQSSYQQVCVHQGISDEEFASKVSNCAGSYPIKRLIDNKFGFHMTYQCIDDSDPAQMDIAENLILNGQNILGPLFHGWYYQMDPITLNNIDQFVYIFPAWISHSCRIGAFSHRDSDTISEALFKAEKGPAFFISSTNKYFFFKDSLEGKTVGEAFYNVGEVITRYTSVSNPLFGDPSLKIFKSPKTIEIGPIKPDASKDIFFREIIRPI
jgi:hypothetical protein